jgi:uncharacterized protein involved in response to NO
MNADDLAKILDELGKRLGPTGSHVFELAVRQVYINAGTAVVCLAIVVALGWIATPRLYRWQQDGNDRDIVCAILGIVYGFVAVIVGLMALIAVPLVFNPEYAAIRDLIGQIK